MNMGRITILLPPFHISDFASSKRTHSFAFRTFSIQILMLFVLGACAWHVFEALARTAATYDACFL